MAKKTRYSIGYNNDLLMLELLEAYSDSVDCLYFPIPPEYLSTGRFRPIEKDYRENIRTVIKTCEKNGINSQILLNATCEAKRCGNTARMKKVTDYLNNLAKIGLKSAAITNPFYITEIKNTIPELELHSSVNCYTSKIEDALYLKDMGIDVLTLDRDINRDLDLIKNIKKATGLKIKLLLNEGCLSNCPFRLMHFNSIAHRTPDAQFLAHSCITVIRKDPKKVFRIPFIRPEDIKHYKPFTDYFKLATRTFTTPQIETTLKAYIDEQYNGDLLDLLDMTGMKCMFTFINNKVLDRLDFFNTMQKCALDCESCTYCDTLLKKAAILNNGNKKQGCITCDVFKKHVSPYLPCPP
ncbi:MAG: U32 family peptidase [archaeon]